jgi:hypothetical protein
MKTGIELIAQERKEQIEKHGRTLDKDIDLNGNYELAWAADILCVTPDQDIELVADLVVQTRLREWDQDLLQRMLSKPYKERLIIAGALIAAEIDRIQAGEE